MAVSNALEIISQQASELHEAIRILNEHKRREEILIDIAFNAGFTWNGISGKVQSQILDSLNGSRGLNDQFKEWAREFDGSPLDDGDNYLENIDVFTTEKMSVLITTIRLEG